MSEESVFLDDVTARIMRVLLENPAVFYNKSQLTKAADVSRPAFYDRFDELRDRRIIEPAEVVSGHQYWTLNSDSELANAFSTLLYPEGDSAE
ncbi:hypothetical protein HTZ84_21010 [Haloterrigena sp. SYSU A558-1]|uniref:ArsR family transcriptional regulator n=1 Tax=Haloterrigena gelatinilytica TaxID=2741724 RepID=A0ABX2LJK3_9EURY|nr:hypothetical protein [Haloterrigena gelatinilytica]NUC74745.1 hypothetical protein [Haloterrigena gelatinilytica]